MPGVLAWLEQWNHHPQVALGIGTGNFAAGARLKLQAAGLEKCFRFGGYASDGPKRENILAAAKTRGEWLLGRPIPEQRTIIIGDTPKDIDAARALGAPVLGVATGPFTKSDLQAKEPNWVVENFAQQQDMAFFTQTCLDWLA
jgi:phosphoglycolate phosphatase-like HAD superfamily hydrolase